jgi:hypothetical protein
MLSLSRVAGCGIALTLAWATQAATPPAAIIQLKSLHRDTPLVALAFECQLFDEIPVAHHDIFMDKIITEDHVYQGKGR